MLNVSYRGGRYQGRRWRDVDDPAATISVKAKPPSRGVLIVDLSTLSFEETSLAAVEVVRARDVICEGHS